MKYSYIKPRKKTPITPELQIIFTFFAITLIMLFTTYAFLLYKDYTFEKDKRTIIENKKELKANTEHMQKQISFIQKQKALAEKVFTQNMVLKDSIANLFDLVPQRITLSRVKLLKNGLILYGITPNKDVYNFMLQAPLRSIFHKTYSSFYPAKNGWLMFVSTNYMDESQIEELDSEN
ncbi:hypothetical protein [Sulfurimonas autotrophica]|uniref:Fimbrial assembly family protein n=1 Tax=Sulfurimonas autotrophica (strain ATCC BAA-671 / DSM 16294 / JCM 11897 / OK10) TaxID=563040 RepID=E0UPK2_SULAO|nr:hypothetical protein [Sulfurimonas autotrophica]ADN08594.1 conserved hypothetical protein [Sulfurimonas autotrophica DSM 16294]